MKNRFVSLLLCLLLVLSVLPLGADAGTAAVSVTDMMGRVITLDAPAERIVALTAADCEILCALGCGGLLVGRGAYCDWPAEMAGVPSVASGAETNIEQIIALRPQVVLMSAMAQTVEQEAALEAAGIRTAVSNAQDIAGTYEAIRMIGTLVGRDAEAEALAAGMQAAFDGIADKAGNTGKTVYFEVSPLQWGLWTAGKGTFMDELAAICGLTNAFADVDGWAEISEEQVLARDPDYIVTITAYGGEGPTPAEEIASRAGWQDLKAVKNSAILNADSNEISRPGPRLADAARTLFAFVTGGEAE